MSLASYVLDRSRSRMKEKLQIENNFLLDKLVEKDVISHYQYEDIVSENVQHRQIDKLITILRKVEDEAFEAFIATVKETDQAAMHDYLQERKAKYVPSADQEDVYDMTKVKATLQDVSSAGRGSMPPHLSRRPDFASGAQGLPYSRALQEPATGGSMPSLLPGRQEAPSGDYNVQHPFNRQHPAFIDDMAPYLSTQREVRVGGYGLPYTFQSQEPDFSDDMALYLSSRQEAPSSGHSLLDEWLLASGNTKEDSSKRPEAPSGGETAPFSSTSQKTASGLHMSPYIWKITGIRQKIQECIRRQFGVSEFYSEKFTTGQRGYVLCGKAVISKMDLGCWICLWPGPHDQRLPWPLRVPVTMTLLDPWGRGNDKVEGLAANQVDNLPFADYMEAYKRPKERELLSPGFTFVPLDQVDRYIKDDAIYIKLECYYSS